MGLYTPTILGGNSYLSWFNDRGAIKDPAHTGTSKGLSQAINRGPIRKSLPKYANVYVTIQSLGLSAGARTHYVTANGARNGLVSLPTLRTMTASPKSKHPARLMNDTLYLPHSITAGLAYLIREAALISLGALMKSLSKNSLAIPHPKVSISEPVAWNVVPRRGWGWSNDFEFCTGGKKIILEINSVIIMRMKHPC